MYILIGKWVDLIVCRVFAVGLFSTESGEKQTKNEALSLKNACCATKSTFQDIKICCRCVFGI